MSNKALSTEQAVALLKIQGLLAAAYDMSRHTHHDFLSYLIKMARMEAHARFDQRKRPADFIRKDGDLDHY